jgi:iron complex outermembrane receptor protein
MAFGPKRKALTMSYQIRPFQSCATALLAGVAIGALMVSSAMAQQVASSVETVVVTGTMVGQENLKTPSPIQVITADTIQNSGMTSTADVVRSLSADNAGSLSDAFNGAFATGAAAVSLRGLTSADTLVLINGHRTSNYPLADDGERTFTDLNTLPMDAVEQIQVLKDGASSIYGADAIAGVVNIILKQNFKGIEGSIEGGASQHGGGQMVHASATFGVGDIDTDHYNFFVNFEFENNQPIRVDQRGFPFNTNDLSSIGGLNNIGGQPQGFSGSIYGSVAPAKVSVTPGATLAPNYILNSKTTGLTQVLNSGGCGALGTKSTDDLGNVYCAQNLLSNTYDQAKSTRQGVYARGSFQVNKDMQLYIDTSYFQYAYFNTLQPAQIQNSTPTNTNQIVLPARLTGPSGPGTGALNPNDPFANSTSCVEGVSCTDAAVNYAFGDIPSFEYTVSHALRSTLGVNGTWNGWNYTGALTIAHSWLDFNYAGFINYNQLVTDVNSGTYNFVNPSANTRALRAALAPTLTSMSTNDEDSVDVSAYRAIFDLPGGSAQLGIGAQYRSENNYNPALNPNFAAQGLGNTFDFGSRSIESIYGELDLPLFPQFDFDMSGRYDHYSDFGDTFNPKAGIKYSPFSWLTLRGTASSGFRAPGFAENGNAQVAAFVTTTAANLSSSFATAHGNDPYVTNSYSLQTINSAFAGVKPETSENFTGGFIVNPLANITVSANYYYIEKWNLIQPPSTGAALDAYFGGAALPAGFSVTPDVVDVAHPSALPRPAVVVAPYSNSGRLITDGLDLSVSTSWDLTDDLHYTLSFEGTRVFEFANIVPGNPKLEYVGTLSPCILVDCEGTPRTKFSTTNDFKFGPWEVTDTLYYTSGLQNIESDIAGPGGSIYPTVPGCCGEFWDLDLHVSYQATDAIQIFGNIKNLLDTDPALEPAQYGGVNYNPSSAQAGIVGRYFQIGARLKM